jgi:hypothetical protein
LKVYVNADHPHQAQKPRSRTPVTKTSKREVA